MVQYLQWIYIRPEFNTDWAGVVLSESVYVDMSRWLAPFYGSQFVGIVP